MVVLSVEQMKKLEEQEKARREAEAAAAAAEAARREEEEEAARTQQGSDGQITGEDVVPNIAAAGVTASGVTHTAPSRASQGSQPQMVSESRPTVNQSSHQTVRNASPGTTAQGERVSSPQAQQTEEQQQKEEKTAEAAEGTDNVRIHQLSFIVVYLVQMRLTTTQHNRLYTFQLS